MQLRFAPSDVEMNSDTHMIRNLARRLIVLELLPAAQGVAGGSEGFRASDKLRVPLAKLAGVAGFRSLMSRALAIAKAEVPSLAPVQVGPDGSLEGFNGSEQNQDAEAGVVVLYNLLNLLVTFIGEPLTLRFVHDAWPDARETELRAGSEEGL